MLDKLAELKARYESIERELGKPEVVADQKRYKALSKEYARLEPLVRQYERLQELTRQRKEAEELLDDPELRQVAREEIERLDEEISKLEEEIKLALVPRDPDADRSCIVEIRSGTGGEEAALFARDLYRMYSRYAERRGWKTEVMNISETGLGGIKEVVFSLEGEGAFGDLKLESGVHRVQRVPQTESSGRIHTSAATVAVLPEVEEIEVEIDPADLEWETHRSPGAGGQHVNKTDSAVRLRHKPTGIVVSCHDERSQHQNRDKALRILRAKLYEMQKKEQQEKIAATRRKQVRSGDRSEKIRTYNFPQGRVTDHRIGLTIHNLEEFLDGDIQPMMDALKAHELEQALAAAAQEGEEKQSS